MKLYKASFAKPSDAALVNEDAVLASGRCIAVSDGAGGGGLYADRWSRYLLSRLRLPLTSFDSLNQWLDGIWESFYDHAEVEAKGVGGLLLDKFYDEGSFATLVAIWRMSPTAAHWISYGDSVAFCYNRRTHQLQHSFTRLADFANPPYLLNYVSELNPAGFRQGDFEIDADCVVFCCSDALSYYVLMQYMVAHPVEYKNEIAEALNVHSKLSNALRLVLDTRPLSFEKDVIDYLICAVKHPARLQRRLIALYQAHLLAADDYSLAVLFP